MKNQPFHRLFLFLLLLGPGLMAGCEFFRRPPPPQTPTAITERGPAPESTVVTATPSRAVVTAPAGPWPTATDDPGRDAWTILIYMDADNSLEPAALLDLHEMELAGTAPGVNVIIQIDRRADANDGPEAWATARRYRLQSDADPAGIGSELLEDLGEINMGDPVQLIDFVTWGLQRYPANRTALIFWDHGAGWLGTAFDDDHPSGSPGDRLILREIAAALEQALAQAGVARLDLIGFDGCLMGQLDVLEAVRPFARYAIASEELTPGTGWAYEGWLRRLNTDPSQSPEATARDVVATYGRHYSQVAPNDFVTLAAVDLDRLPAVTLALAGLTAAIGHNFPLEAAAVADARAGVEAYARLYRERSDFYGAVDLAHFAALLARRSQSPTVQASANALTVAVRQAVLAASRSAGLPQASGIAIYFPRSGAWLAPEYAAQTSLAGWHQFLVRYHAEIPAAGAPPSVAIQVNEVDEISLHNPAYMGFEIAGRGIADVQFWAGLHRPDGRRRLLELDPLIPEPQVLADGSRIEAWRQGVHEDFFVWLPEATYLTDGTSGDFVVMRPTHAARRWTVAGRYQVQDTGESVEAILVFDRLSGRLEGVWARQPEQEVPYELLPSEGDIFQVYDLYLDPDNNIQEEPGIMLAMDPDSLSYEWRPLPSGTYFAGFQVQNQAGEMATALSDLSVNNDGVDPAYKAYRDPYLGFQFHYPAEWRRPTYDRAVCGGAIDALCASDETGATWLYLSLFPNLAPGVRPEDLRRQTLQIFGPVTVLYEDELTIDGQRGRRTAYGYSSADGERTGVFVAFVREGTGFVLDIDGPQAGEAATLAALEVAAATWTTRPAGSGLFPGRWSRLNQGGFSVAHPSDFAYSLLVDGWHLFDAGDHTFLALRSDPADGSEPATSLNRWLATTSSVTAFAAQPPFALAIGDQSWLRTDFRWLAEDGTPVRGFIMATRLGDRQVVAWAEAPAAVMDQIETETFLVMIADFKLE